MQARRDELERKKGHVMEESLSLIAMISDSISRVKTLVKRQNTIEHHADFLRNYPDTLSQVNRVLGVLVKMNCDFQICVPSGTEVNDLLLEQKLSDSSSDKSSQVSSTADVEKETESFNSETSFSRDESIDCEVARRERSLLLWKDLDKDIIYEATFVRCDKTCSLWLQLLSEPESVCELVSQLELRIANNSLPFCSSPTVGQLVIAKCDITFRGCVLAVSNFGIKLVDLDNGNTKICSADQLWEMDEEAASLRAGVLLCNVWKIDHWLEEYSVILEKLLGASNLDVQIIDKVPTSPPLFVVDIVAFQQEAWRVDVKEFIETHLIKKSQHLDKVKSVINKWKFVDILKSFCIPEYTQELFQSTSDSDDDQDAAIDERKSKGAMKEKNYQEKEKEEIGERSCSVSTASNDPGFQIKTVVESNCTYQMSFLDSGSSASPWSLLLVFKPNKEFSALMNKLSLKVERGDLNSISSPTEGSYVIGKKSHYFRGYISNVDQAKGLCTVLDIDNARVYVMSPKTLWNIDNECARVPPQALNCSLWGVPTTCPHWSVKFADFFSSVLKKYDYLVEIIENTNGKPAMYIVRMLAYSGEVTFDVGKWVSNHVIPQLWKFASNKNIQVSISFKELDPSILYEDGQFCTFAEECEDRKSIDIEHRKTQAVLKLPNFSAVPGICYDVYVSHVVSPDELYVQVISQTNDDFYEMEDSLRLFYEKNRVGFTSKREIQEIISEFCAVNFEGKWYRARILNWLVNCDSLVSVVLIDYGLCSYVSCDSIEPLDNSFFEYNQFAVKCKLACVSPPCGFDTWPSESVEALKDIIHKESMYELSIKNVEGCRNPCVVLTYRENDAVLNINRYLIDEGFAK